MVYAVHGESTTVLLCSTGRECYRVSMQYMKRVLLTVRVQSWNTTKQYNIVHRSSKHRYSGKVKHKSETQSETQSERQTNDIHLLKLVGYPPF